MESMTTNPISISEALEHPSPSIRALGERAQAAGGWTPGDEHFVTVLADAYAERPKRVQARPGITIELVRPRCGEATVRVVDPWGATLTERFEDHEQARHRANELYKLNKGPES